MNSKALLVLMVEPNAAIAGLARHFLEHYGFKTAFAADGVQGLRMASELLPDVLITEILVPRLDGLAVCRQLKSTERTRDVKILIFSILRARERALAAGADAFLLKPLQENLLLKTVTNLINTSGGDTVGSH